MIPQQEQQYLTHVLEELSKAYTTTAEAVTQKDDAYKDLQQYTIDYHAELDKMEIYNHQQTLSMIDKQGHAKVLAKKRLEKLIDTSYRSSYEIMQYAKQFRNANVTPIARHGEEPLELTCTTLEELARTISQKITSPSTAVICKNQQQLELLRSLLALPILDGSTVHFTNEPVLTTVQYAKGLEFDTVIIPFKESYTTDYDKGLLYIGCTRAMHELMLLSLIDAV